MAKTKANGSAQIHSCGFERLGVPAPSGLFWAYRRYLLPQLISSHLEGIKTAAPSKIASPVIIRLLSEPRSCGNHRFSDRERSNPRVRDTPGVGHPDGQAPGCSSNDPIRFRRSAASFLSHESDTSVPIGERNDRGREATLSSTKTFCVAKKSTVQDYITRGPKKPQHAAINAPTAHPTQL